MPVCSHVTAPCSVSFGRFSSLVALLLPILVYRMPLCLHVRDCATRLGFVGFTHLLYVVKDGVLAYMKGPFVARHPYAYVEKVAVSMHMAQSASTKRAAMSCRMWPGSGGSYNFDSTLIGHFRATAMDLEDASLA